MVTHQVHFLPKVDKIILLNDGGIKAIGTYKEILNSGINMDALLSNFQNEDRNLLKSFNENQLSDGSEISLTSSKSDDEENISETDDLIASNQVLEITESNLFLNVNY